ncbi:MAG: Hsp20/alpha crystallin family protein [Candidatus Freyarchaeota archaeon]|nr:Hsp20/alpha crystallin family protein [Candidatus Freyrarchaeum guaymaensis]HDO80712.1 Hsp20/alpha crystallin family protein [Candidatus Bathyarchaeota archaeon]
MYERRRRREAFFERLLNYFTELGEEIDEFVESMFEAMRFSRPDWDMDSCCIEPLVHVESTPDSIIVTADLPYVEGKENIKLNATEDTLEILAEMKKDVRFEKWGTIQREATFRKYHKIIRLPEKVVPEEARATFKNGVLQVILPKKVKKTPIKIE